MGNVSESGLTMLLQFVLQSTKSSSDSWRLKVF